jgi:ABC-type transport system substrate-binding protein
MIIVQRRFSVYVGVLLAVACGGGAAPNRRTIIDSRDNYDPRSLDPALSTDVPTGRAVAYVFDGLTSFTPDARVEPALAERWDVSPDGARYVFHLRRGVTFTDGTPVTARTVVASWQRALDPATKGGRGEPLQPIRGARDFAAGKARSIAGLSAPDDSTVMVQLEEPLGIFPKLLAMPVAAVVPPNMASDRPVGTGPWRLVEWKHDDYVLFAKNAGYWAGAPKADSLRARIIAEPSTAVAEFESGNVDVLLIPAGETRQWEDDESKKGMLMSVPALQLVYIGINTTRGPLKDARVRQAINLAIDRKLIVQRLISGRGRLTASFHPRLAVPTPCGRPILSTSRARSSCFSRRAFPTASRSSCGSAPIRSMAAFARPCRPICRRRGSAPRSCSASRPPLAKRRGRDRPT